MNKNELGLLDIILVIAKRKTLVISICLSCSYWCYHLFTGSSSILGIQKQP